MSEINLQPFNTYKMQGLRHHIQNSFTITTFKYTYPSVKTLSNEYKSKVEIKLFTFYFNNVNRYLLFSNSEQVEVVINSLQLYITLQKINDFPNKRHFNLGNILQNNAVTS